MFRRGDGEQRHAPLLGIIEDRMRGEGQRGREGGGGREGRDRRREGEGLGSKLPG